VNNHGLCDVNGPVYDGVRRCRIERRDWESSHRYFLINEGGAFIRCFECEEDARYAARAYVAGPVLIEEFSAESSALGSPVAL
jgi:hypothetical protein